MTNTTSTDSSRLRELREFRNEQLGHLEVLQRLDSAAQELGLDRSTILFCLAATTNRLQETRELIREAEAIENEQR